MLYVKKDFPFNLNFLKTSLVLTALLSLASCIDGATSTKRSTGGSDGSSSFVNSSSNLPSGKGRILSDNPIILTKNYNLDYNINLNELLTADDHVEITSSQFLSYNCSTNSTTQSNCYKNLDSEYASPISNSTTKWAYDANSNNFMQVNTFGHTKKILDQFFADLGYSFSNRIVSTSSYNANTISNGMFWFGTNNPLVSYSNCDVKDNAFYAPAENSLCYGHDAVFPSLKFAEDPTIIYHETGHALQHIMLNLRTNKTAYTPVTLGQSFYDEAGSIGEGISDWFSYYVNDRTHFAEWALGRYLNASRPMRETDPLHVGGVSTAASERLKYPDYVMYNPNDPEELIEDTHYAGMIISHYLVALTEDLVSKCSFSLSFAKRKVLGVMAESFAELGAQDLSGYNHNVTNYERLWISSVKPINFRSFAQTMAKYLYYNLSTITGQCGSGIYSTDRIEQLLDEYGLLLFKTYNLDGNNVADGHSNTKAVNSQNRIRTVLIEKKHIKIDDSFGATHAVVLDTRSELVKARQSFIASGVVSTGNLSSRIPADLSYNNGNGKVSPGEMVGIVLNLYNDSNAPMAGVQVLANDWDHVRSDGPCNNLGDNFPTTNEGAADLTESPNSLVADSSTEVGDCSYTTRDNGDTLDDSASVEIAPVCLMQTIENDATKWVTQKQYVSDNNVSSSKCLDGNDTSDCFIRAITGADSAYYAKIDPKKNWTENYFKDGRLDINTSKAVYFETSSWIKPGTTFMCRFRVRFTNCDDCYHDSANSNDDYYDYEFSGHKPFKIVNLKFTVID